MPGRAFVELGLVGLLLHLLVGLVGLVLHIRPLSPVIILVRLLLRFSQLGPTTKHIHRKSQK